MNTVQRYSFIFLLIVIVPQRVDAFQQSMAALRRSTQQISPTLRRSTQQVAPYISKRYLTSAQAATILGVQSGATPQEIKSAYHKQAKHWHPDYATRRGVPATEANKKMREITEAFDQLKKQPIWQSAYQSNQSSYEQQEQTYEQKEEPKKENPSMSPEQEKQYDELFKEGFRFVKSKFADSGTLFTDSRFSDNEPVPLSNRLKYLQERSWDEKSIYRNENFLALADTIDTFGEATTLAALLQPDFKGNIFDILTALMNGLERYDNYVKKFGTKTISEKDLKKFAKVKNFLTYLPNEYKTALSLLKITHGQKDAVSHDKFKPFLNTIKQFSPAELSTFSKKFGPLVINNAKLSGLFNTFLKDFFINIARDFENYSQEETEVFLKLFSNFSYSVQLPLLAKCTYWNLKDPKEQHAERYLKLLNTILESHQDLPTQEDVLLKKERGEPFLDTIGSYLNHSEHYKRFLQSGMLQKAAFIIDESHPDQYPKLTELIYYLLKIPNKTIHQQLRTAIFG